ncbi:glycogenin-2 [Orycteropus afer afer]|uniref:glycogenin glucosyltransferase n=1 Tax=Orycteropus afer afer TaxID=1230840 RepID=A0A8B7BAB5_ORYAF|nr:glycogenin-2 [Orycteropus afer afer]
MRRNQVRGNTYRWEQLVHGSTVAKIVSPIVSLVVLTLVGAATRYFTQNRRNSCFRRNVADQAFVTLATNDVCCQGALVLGQSLRSHGATRRLVVLITPPVSHLLRAVLSRVFDEVVEVNVINSADCIPLARTWTPELGVSLTKLHCWALTRYSKCVFLDADTLVLSNIDELFDRGELSAAPDPGWPDCFNTSVFVFQPSLETHSRLLQHAADHGSFDGADQGLLNSFFSSWSTADIHKHLPFIYNLSMAYNMAYTYHPAFKQFGSAAKVVRFLGCRKPWSYKYNPQMGSVVQDGTGTAIPQQLAFLNLWWNIYHSSVLPLFENLRNVAEHTSPGHAVPPGGLGEPCARSVSGPTEPPPTEVPPEKPVVVEETPSCPKECHQEDVTGGPATGTPAGVLRDPISPPSPQFSDVTEAETPSQPVDNGESGPSEDTLAPRQAPPAEATREPAPRDMLEVGLAVSVSAMSIEEKVREPSPEEERRKWEDGHIDYLGRDGFARIQAKLDRFLQ